MERISVPLTTLEKTALIKIAQKEYRDPRYQAAMIIREELIRRGFVIAEDHSQGNNQQAHSGIESHAG